MKLIFIASILFSTGVTSLFAQPQITGDDYLVSGYENKISGDDYEYHSSIKTNQESLIVRATDGNYSMVWETAPVPDNVTSKYVTFVWLAGLGSSPGFAQMDLVVNDQLAFTFNLDGKDEWKLIHPNGSELFFYSDFTDQFGDHFGFMFLRIPGKNIKNQERLILQVTGSDHQLSSWYMTFKQEVKEGMSIDPLPAITINNEKEMQELACGVIYFGKPVQASYYAGDEVIKVEELEFGYNAFHLRVPTVEKLTNATISVEAGDNIMGITFELKPVKKWHVNFVQHSHTDIGYTRSQADILAEHMRFIDYALDYCDQTDHYPEEAQFRWTCEASWAVNEYLKSRPEEQIERLVQRVKEGRIELSGMYLNFDELPDEQTLAASLAPIQVFKDRGMPVDVAMQDDVNGIAWCLNDYYQDLGVKYLNMGTHGHRALICFDKPTLFWWESPSGKRMLTFRAEHYMTGNHLRLVSGNFEEFEMYLLNYLSDLQIKGYPYDKMSIQFSGYLTDNSPPSTLACEMIKKWNDIYEWPKIRTSTLTAFFEDMEARYSEEFPVYRGAWPDWWTDGFGASAREVAIARKVQSDIIANMSGAVMAGAAGNQIPESLSDEVDLVNDALLFYTEHTVGYHASVREPYHRQSMEQRAIKESYAWESYRRSRLLREDVLGLLQANFKHEQDPSVVVFNTLNFKRDGLVRLFIDHQIVPENRSFALMDKSGQVYPAQLESHHSGGSWWVVWLTDIQAFGFKKFLIVLQDQPYEDEITGSADLENNWYRIKTDISKAAIVSFYDKDLEKELLDKEAAWAMGQFIYERLGNRRQMEMFRLDDYTRVPLDSAWFESSTEGPVWKSVLLKGRTEASMDGYDYTVEFRLFKPVKRIDLVYSIVKKPIVEPEGIYISFPFSLDGGKLYFDVPGGTIEAGKDQIPGSANDWNTVQNFASVRSSHAQIVLMSPEIPLMQMGGINTGRFVAGALPESTNIYSWPMNNYWTTNFNATQTGTHDWTYSITSGQDQSNGFATRFGWNGRIPFLTRVFPGGGDGDEKWKGNYIGNWPVNAMLVSATPITGEKAALMHIREVDGKEVTLDLTGPDGSALRMVETDVLGHENSQSSMHLMPWESKFYKMYW